MRFPVGGEGLWATVRAATVAMAYRCIGLDKSALCSAILLTTGRGVKNDFVRQPSAVSRQPSAVSRRQALNYFQGLTDSL